MLSEGQFVNWNCGEGMSIACDMAQDICHMVRCGGKHDYKSNGKGIVGCIKQIMQVKASNIKKCPITTAIRSQMKTSR